MYHPRVEIQEIRRLRPDELEEVARIWRRSREDAQPWLEARMAHSAADDVRHLATRRRDRRTRSGSPRRTARPLR
jgi:hypothetical protein